MEGQNYHQKTKTVTSAGRTVVHTYIIWDCPQIQTFLKHVKGNLDKMRKVVQDLYLSVIELLWFFVLHLYHILYILYLTVSRVSLKKVQFLQQIIIGPAAVFLQTRLITLNVHIIFSCTSCGDIDLGDFANSSDQSLFVPS